LLERLEVHRRFAITPTRNAGPPTRRLCGGHARTNARTNDGTENRKWHGNVSGTGMRGGRQVAERAHSVHACRTVYIVVCDRPGSSNRPASSSQDGKRLESSRLSGSGRDPMPRTPTSCRRGDVSGRNLEQTP
jgi:hypothetical protein